MRELFDMPPEVTAEEWANMAQAAAQPGTNAYSVGLKERLSSLASIKDKKIFGRPLYEVAADFGAGFAVKTAVRAGVMMAGASTLGAIGAAVVAGAASGAIFAGGKEWFKQVGENWQQPLPPEAVTKRQKLLERLNELNPNDWGKVGTVAIKGAAVGAVFGLAGGLLAQALHAGVPSSEPFTGGDHAVATPTVEPTHAADTLGGTAAPDHITTPTTNIPTMPGTDVHTPVPGITPHPDVAPSHSADISSTSPTHTPITTPDQSPVPSPHADIPGAQGESTHIPSHTPTPGPDSTIPSQPPENIPNHPIDVPATHPTDIPTLPAEIGTMPPLEHAFIPPIDTITEGINNLKDVPLSAGSNPWEVATEILKQADPDHIPTNTEIMEVTKAIAAQNNISVPEWGISGSVDEHKIPIGYLIKLTPAVKSVITDVIKGAK